jgi:hypothetical protein
MAVERPVAISDSVVLWTLLEIAVLVVTGLPAGRENVPLPL